MNMFDDLAKPVEPANQNLEAKVVEQEGWADNDDWGMDDIEIDDLQEESMSQPVQDNKDKVDDGIEIQNNRS